MFAISPHSRHACDWHIHDRRTCGSPADRPKTGSEIFKAPPAPHAGIQILEGTTPTLDSLTFSFGRPLPSTRPNGAPEVLFQIRRQVKKGQVKRNRRRKVTYQTQTQTQRFRFVGPCSHSLATFLTQETLAYQISRRSCF
jgi:hypothetical protein